MCLSLLALEDCTVNCKLIISTLIKSANSRYLRVLVPYRYIKRDQAQKYNYKVTRKNASRIAEQKFHLSVSRNIVLNQRHRNRLNGSRLTAITRYRPFFDNWSKGPTGSLAGSRRARARCLRSELIDISYLRIRNLLLPKTIVLILPARL